MLSFNYLSAFRYPLSLRLSSYNETHRTDFNTLVDIISLFKISGWRPLRIFADFYTSVFRGTPLLLQLALVYYATPQLTGYSISALEAGVVTFALNSAAYTSETIRGGILAVDKGQSEAAKSLGVPYKLMMGWDWVGKTLEVRLRQSD